jgi:arylsulfatase A-like enzyme/Tfp pilus assembly protein PilF
MRSAGDSTIGSVLRPALLAAIAAVSLLGLPVKAQRALPNVLLVTIDTLRADRVGAYGYAQARTPVLDRLAKDGVRFADATTHAPLTYPAHVAIVTGRYPGVFNARANGMNPLPADANTLAERLKGAGYETAAVIGSVVLERAYGLDQGFDDYDDRIEVRPSETVAIADLQRPASAVTSAATAWLERRATTSSGRPWFLWTHYYDPHLPYDAPAKYAAAFPGRPYDAEIAYVDAELGRLLSSIDRKRTLVIVTADHGEALGEHGEPDHGFFLYDSTLHVPLIIAGPQALPGAGPGRPARETAPRVVTEQVRSIDIVPTIADIVGLPPDPAAHGESLVPVMQGRTRNEVPVSFAESWYPLLHFGWSELRAARVGEWKYIAAPKPELYDLRTDRKETRNVIHDRGAVAGRLAAELQRAPGGQVENNALKTPAQPDQATAERLRALGYVGTFAPVTAESRKENPLDHAVEYREYRDLFTRALTLLEQKRPGPAATILQRLVKTNVRAFEAHLYLGNAYAAQGKSEAALGEYDLAAILNPMVASPHFEAAKVLSARGDHRAAVERCRQGLSREPRSFYGHYTLGVVYQKARQWTEALETFSRAVELNDRDPRAHANLAGAAMRTGDLDRASVHFERMIELNHQVAPAHFNLGVIAARKGDQAEAARRYKLALSVDPAFKPASDALKRLRPASTEKRLWPARGAKSPSESERGWGPASAEKRLRPARGAKSPSESERGWGPASAEK